MRHNNIIPNVHFHKDWQRYVRTWFDQPARKLKRRRTRTVRAAKMAPRPTDLLRPAVRCPTVKYNMRLRAGRGFSLDELKAAGVRRKEALTVGIPIDHRRRNMSQEAFHNNVARIKAYKSRLIIFPLNPTAKRARAGDATKAERAKAKQIDVAHVMPIKSYPKSKLKVRKMTEEEKKPRRSVFKTLRKVRRDQRLKGIKEKKAKDKKEGKVKDKKKKAAPAAEEEAGGDE